MSLSPGVRLGRYEIIALIGAGGMGEVYRARDERLKRDVALKVLPASFSTDPDRLRRFEQEAQAAGSLNHPNVLAIYDVGTHDGSPFIVSELLEGETLRRRLAGGSLPVPAAFDIAMQTTEGLAAAHEKGIVHRDLKPENLFITTGGRAKILDFGLAKLADPALDVPDAHTNMATVGAPTEVGTVLGTVGYMSPEQVRGERADHRSDIFSFGAILYEMLTGRRAFAGGSAADTMSAILRDQPPPLSPNLTLPPAIERVVRRCLEKRADDRFQTARDLRFALGEAASGLSVPIAALQSPPSRARRAWWVAAAGLALLAATLALMSGLVDLRRMVPGRGGDGPRIASLAVLPLQNLSNDPEQEYFSDGMTEALISDLARVSGLRLISRTSAMTYRSTQKTLPQIARELNVDAVVVGTVVRSGGRVRITAQLIDAKTDRHLWANSYERDLRDVLTLQAEVARAVAQEIRDHADTAG